MAERWQQWMPFHIDKFRGSPDVQAMHPAARLGYLYLLASAWQTDDCTVSSDPMDLATESGLGDELWGIHGPRILRKFAICDGRLRNAVVFEEWSLAKKTFESGRAKRDAVHEARVAAGKAGAANRWQTDGKPIANAKQSGSKTIAKDSLTGTGTGTGTEVQRQKLASTAVAVAASPPYITFPLTGGKTHIVTEADISAWEKAYPAVDIRAELQKVLVWLDAHPDRRSVAINGSKQRIVKWLTRTQNEGGSRGTHRFEPGVTKDRDALPEDVVAELRAKRKASGIPG